ncbi:hypothetical protein ABTE96_20950, partial [Acinetobacter baumannii]
YSAHMHSHASLHLNLWHADGPLSPFSPFSPIFCPAHRRLVGVASCSPVLIVHPGRHQPGASGALAGQHALHHGCLCQR